MKVPVPPRSGMHVSNDNHLPVPVPIVDMVMAHWQFKCVSSVAGVGLQDLANRANQIIDQKLNLTNQTFLVKQTLKMELFVQKQDCKMKD